VPIGGFAQLRGANTYQKFRINLMPNSDTNSLPRSHTCFNELDLPKYESLFNMEEKFKKAMEFDPELIDD
jgi:hypothetical protein